MVTKRKSRRRAGSQKRDAQHRAGGEWNTLTIPDGVDIWQPKEGNHRIDIVPFVAGKGNPYAEPDELYYERTFFVHRGIGPNSESHVCLARTFGKSCPICEYRAKLSSDPDADDKLQKNLKPRERQLFLVYDRKEPEKKIQLWEVSHFTFGKLLDKRRQDAEEDEPHITDFDDSASGSMLKVGFEEEDGGGFTFLKAYSIDFKPRPDGLPEKLTDHGICLDDLIKETPYDRLKSIFHQEEETDEGSDDDEPDERLAKKRKKSPPIEDNDKWDEEDEAEAVAEEIAKKRKKKAPPVEDDDDEPEKKKPAPKKGKMKKPIEDDDEWDDDFDDDPSKKKGKKKAAEPDDDDDDDDDWPVDDPDEDDEAYK